jgi:hypothetical protein
MTNVQEALKEIRAIVLAASATDDDKLMQILHITNDAITESALSDIEKCEPVAEALHERNRLGYAVVDVIGTLDEIIENAQEVEVDDFLHIAIPIDKWHELQDALEEMPKRAELYTSPISKEWVGLSDQQIQNLIINSDNYNKFQFIKSVEHTVKQINAPEKG